MPIYLACGPGERIPPLAPPYMPARLGYRLAADYPSLLGPDFTPGVKQGYLVLQDGPQPPYEPSRALAQMIVDLCRDSFDGLICDFDLPQTPFYRTLITLLDEQAAACGLPLVVTQAYADDAPHASVLLAFDLAQQGFAAWLEGAAQRYPGRLVLELRPTRVELSLPCPTGAGRTLSAQQLHERLTAHNPALFQDDALLCEYFGFLEEQALHFVLFDSAKTLQQKITLAEQAGCVCAIGLYQELQSLIP